MLRVSRSGDIGSLSEALNTLIAEKNYGRQRRDEIRS